MILTRRRPVSAGARLIGTLALLGLASPLFAAVPEYNYLQGSWLRVSPDDANIKEADGYQARLSAPLEPGSFLSAAYSRYEQPASNAKVSALSIGVGMYSRMASGADLYGTLSYETLDLKVVDKVAGYSLELGMRWAIGSRFELDAGARYLNLDDTADSVIGFGGLMFRLSPTLALAAQYSHSDEDRRYTAGLRFFSIE